MTDLSPAAAAVWAAFNEEEAGVFVDYGEKIGAALEALADQVVPEKEPPYPLTGMQVPDQTHPVALWGQGQRIRSEILNIAAELKQ